MGTYETLHKLPNIERKDELDKETGTNISVTPEDINVAQQQQQQQQAAQPLQVETIDDSAATTQSPSSKTNFVPKVPTPIPPPKNTQETNSHNQPAHDEQKLK